MGILDPTFGEVFGSLDETKANRGPNVDVPSSPPPVTNIPAELKGSFEQLKQEQATGLAEHQDYARRMTQVQQASQQRTADLGLVDRLDTMLNPEVPKSARHFLFREMSRSLSIDPKGEQTKEIGAMLTGLDPEASSTLRSLLSDQSKQAQPGALQELVRGILTGAVPMHQLVQMTGQHAKQKALQTGQGLAEQFPQPMKLGGPSTSESPTPPDTPVGGEGGYAISPDVIGLDYVENLASRAGIPRDQLRSQPIEETARQLWEKTPTDEVGSFINRLLPPGDPRPWEPEFPKAPPSSTRQPGVPDIPPARLPGLMKLGGPVDEAATTQPPAGIQVAQAEGAVDPGADFGDVTQGRKANKDQPFHKQQVVPELIDELGPEFNRKKGYTYGDVLDQGYKRLATGEQAQRKLAGQLQADTLNFQNFLSTTDTLSKFVAGRPEIL